MLSLPLRNDSKWSIYGWYVLGSSVNLINVVSNLGIGLKARAAKETKNNKKKKKIPQHWKLL